MYNILAAVLSITCRALFQVVRSIGYKTVPLDKDIPLDPMTGIIPNIAGRVTDSKIKKIL